MAARGAPGRAVAEGAAAGTGARSRGRGVVLAAQAAVALGLLGVVLISPRAAWAEPLWLSTTVGGGTALATATWLWWRGGPALPLLIVDLWFAVYGSLLGRGVDPALDRGPDPSRDLVDALFGPLSARYPVGVVWLVAGLLGAACVVTAGRRASSRRAG